MKRTMMFAAIAVVTLAVHANPTQISNGVMASKEGKTLYTFDKDVKGKSNCNYGRKSGAGRRRLFDRQARRWRIAVGVQGHAPVFLRRRCQSGRCQR